MQNLHEKNAFFMDKKTSSEIGAWVHEVPQTTPHS